MCRKKYIVTALLSVVWGSMRAQVVPAVSDSIYRTESMMVKKKQPWAAAGKVLAINTGVWAFNRFITHEDFADISGKTIVNNLKTGFVWDNDQFSTNLFAHPYHGNLYFNAARNSGMNFWTSIPFALGGSLLWEVVEESEPAAINDLMATTIGGVALGEVMHRMSALVLDDSQRGFQRFWREFVGFAISPMRGLRRLVHGDMWRVRRSNYLYHNFQETPVRFSLGVGGRYLADNNHMFRGSYSPYVQMKLQYGDPFDNEKSLPYDFFTFDATFGFLPGQPVIPRINLLGKIWDTSWMREDGMELAFGIYQHFNYFDSEPTIKGSDRIPYKMSEAASVGFGLMYSLPKVNDFLELGQSAHVSGILLGGSLSDYYNVFNRNYNMGSGYSIKSRTALDFANYAQLELNMQFYQIFTWKGYENKDVENIDPIYLNVQGDKGNALLCVLNPSLRINLTQHLKANIESTFYWRKTHYVYLEDVKYNTFETRIGLMYQF